MIMSTLKELTALGIEMGYEGEELRHFVKDQQDRQREERKEKRDMIQKEQQVERERHDYELKMAQIKFETEKAAHEVEMKVREKDILVEEEQMKIKLLQMDHEHRLELLDKQNEVGESTLGSSSQSGSGLQKVPKMPPFDENNDEMDSYLRRFERYAIAVKWKKDIWATNLSALLKGRALVVYARMPVENALDYDELKLALLKRFELTEEGFKKRFRSCRPEKGETYSQFAVRLESYMKRWIEMADIESSFKDLLDLIVRDQFLHICNKELTLFLLERTPKSSVQMAKFADQYCEARSLPASSFVFGRNEQAKHKSLERSRSVERKSESYVDIRDRRVPSNTRRCYRCGKTGHIASDCRINFSQRKPIASVQVSDRQRSQSPYRVRFRERKDESWSNSRSSTPGSSDVKVCNAFIPMTDSILYSSQGPSTSLSSSCDVSTSSSGMPTSTGLIGDSVVSVLRDTGCSGVVVRRSCISENQITEKRQVCILADGTKVEVPIVNIHVDTPYFTGMVEAWCMKTPIYDLIIGNISGARNAEDPDPNWNPEVSVVQTRQQAKTVIHSLLGIHTVSMLYTQFLVHTHSF